MKKDTETFNTLIMALFRCHQAVNMLGEKLAQPHMLTIARWKVLGAITLDNCALTVPQIARNMGLTRQAVQRTVDELSKIGHVVALMNPAHKRSVLYDITPTGLLLFQDINQDWEKVAISLSAQIQTETITTTTQGLKQLSELIEQE